MAPMANTIHSFDRVQHTVTYYSYAVLQFCASEVTTLWRCTDISIIIIIIIIIIISTKPMRTLV